MSRQTWMRFRHKFQLCCNKFKSKIAYLYCLILQRFIWIVNVFQCDPVELSFVNVRYSVIFASLRWTNRRLQSILEAYVWESAKIEIEKRQFLWNSFLSTLMTNKLRANYVGSLKTIEKTFKRPTFHLNLQSQWKSI